MRQGLSEFLLKDKWVYFPILSLSSATFLFQITLTRLFAIAYFYHFAFMIVSLALLGIGASGSFLSLFPILKRENIRRMLPILCAGCAGSILGSYLLFNRLPFDAYAVAIEPGQIPVFLMHFLALSAPFFFIGLCVNGLMKIYPENSNRIYAVNLAGSALGCLLAPILLPILTGEGVVCLCAAMAALSGLTVFVLTGCGPVFEKPLKNFKDGAAALVCVAILLAAIPEVWRRAEGSQGNPLFDLYLSPYKSLSYTLQYPGARIADTRWNAFSRVDVVSSGGIRSLPGLSYIYTGLVTADIGLFVDGDNLSPVLSPGGEDNYFDYLPQSLAYILRPSARVLVLEPRGGLDLLAAQAGGASAIFAVEPNPLLVREAGKVYTQPNLVVFTESPRSFLHSGRELYDVIIMSLASTYHPVTSGAYSLGEDYRYTAESVRAALARLKPDGLLVLNRWLQMPPSEFLRAFILVVDALESSGMDPRQQIAALRGYNLGTLIVKRSPFLKTELEEVRAFAESRAFDLVYLPDIQPGETNRFNILPENSYFLAFSGYLNAIDRNAWLREYPYDVSPPTDNKPFFGHFFKWSQVRQVLAAYGKTWQPFGGAGYLVVVFLLLVVLVFSVLLILLPVLVRRFKQNHHGVRSTVSLPMGRGLLYFTLLGFGYMFVEIPLIQKFILLLGQPAYAFSAVLFALLLASGLGSFLSNRLGIRWMLALGLGVCLAPLWLDAVIRLAMGLPLFFRLLIMLVCLAPFGFLMGVPFPKGISLVQTRDTYWVSWFWAVNGVASVVASVMSAMLVLSFGFSLALASGGICYLLAFVIIHKFFPLQEQTDR